MEQHCGEYFRAVSGKSACLGASMNCLYTDACCTANKKEELEVPAQLKGYGLIQITDMVE